MRGGNDSLVALPVSNGSGDGGLLSPSRVSDVLKQVQRTVGVRLVGVTGHESNEILFAVDESVVSAASLAEELLVRLQVIEVRTIFPEFWRYQGERAPRNPRRIQVAQPNPKRSVFVIDWSKRRSGEWRISAYMSLSRPVAWRLLRSKAERGPPSIFDIGPHSAQCQGVDTADSELLGGGVFFAFTIGRIRLCRGGVARVRDDGCNVTTDFVDLPPAAGRDHVVGNGLCREKRCACYLDLCFGSRPCALLEPLRR